MYISNSRYRSLHDWLLYARRLASGSNLYRREYASDDHKYWLQALSSSQDAVFKIDWSIYRIRHVPKKKKKKRREKKNKTREWRSNRSGFLWRSYYFTHSHLACRKLRISRPLRLCSRFTKRNQRSVKLNKNEQMLATDLEPLKRKFQTSAQI